MKGYALRGLFGGFFAGLFLAITLWIYAVIPFASDLMWILPLVGLVIGLALAAWAPFGSSAEPEAAEASAGQFAGRSRIRAPRSYAPRSIRLPSNRSTASTFGRQTRPANQTAGES